MPFSIGGRLGGLGDLTNGRTIKRVTIVLLSLDPPKPSKSHWPKDDDTTCRKWNDDYGTDEHEDHKIVQRDNNKKPKGAGCSSNQLPLPLSMQPIITEEEAEEKNTIILLRRRDDDEGSTVQYFQMQRTHTFPDKKEK